MSQSNSVAMMPGAMSMKERRPAGSQRCKMISAMIITTAATA